MMDGCDPSAQATFVAAVIAGAVALAAVIVTIVDGRATRRATRDFTEREQSWTRWSWAIEKAMSDRPAESEIGVAMMDALSDMPWLSEDDERIGFTASAAVAARNTREAAEPPKPERRCGRKSR